LIIDAESDRRWSRPVVGAIAFAVLAAANGQTASAPSTQAGVYSEQQAIRGQQLFYTHCVACHGEDMSGLDQAPPLAGPQFSAIWNGESLWALVQRIETMPPTQPGALSREDNVALLTYMLWYNGLPLGEAPLGTEQGLLAGMTFVPPEDR
jgi:mono/diheme cytochrome c family protein